MKLRDVIKVIRNRNLPNVTERIITDDENAINLINDGLLSLYTQFDICLEQALILVPKNRNIFRIHSSDPNVILNSAERLSKAHTITDITENKQDKNSMIKELKLDKNVEKTLLENSAVKVDLDIDSSEILKILSIEDDKGNEYDFNVKNVFVIKQDTLYFPECKEKDQIYVKYKPKPFVYKLEDLDKELNLPETFYECLYAYINLKVVSGIDGLKEFYANVLNTYNQCLEKALMNSYSLPRNLNCTLHLKKGFY